MSKQKVKYATVDISSLHFDPQNARHHPDINLRAIEGSLKEFGQQMPILVQRDGRVVAGNGTMQAAINLGWKMIDVQYTDHSGQKAIALALAMNRSAELADWDKPLLGQQLQTLLDDGFQIADIGFDPGDWLANFEPAGADEQGKLDERKLKTCPECGHQF